MCAAYTLRPTPEQIQNIFEISVGPDFQFDHRILLHSDSLVVIWEKSLVLKTMKFSLTPFWSKEPKVKFATHNARLETLIEKPTWREPLKSHRCLIPITEFIEPIYSGPYAGNMVRFSDSTRPLLVAAGIFDIWVNKTTGEVRESFSIITSEPPKFIAEMGHDRCPVFLNKDIFKLWLDTKNYDSKAATELLRAQMDFNKNYAVTIDRPLAKGWEKRA